MQIYKQKLAEILAGLKEGLTADSLADLLEYPPNPEMGEISLPCFKLSKVLRRSPQQIADELQQHFPADPAVLKVQSVSGYLNFYLNPEKLARDIVTAVLANGQSFGSQNEGNGKTIVIDYSSPNIAKPFHIGHLRSTVIGNALYRIYTTLGYRCVGINHLGDWGTQFGKMIVAYRNWGNEQDVVEGGVSELLRLYVKIHEEEEKDPALADEARNWFVKLEQGDEEALALWRWFKEISLKEFERIYNLLGVTFDSDAGESFYNDKMAPVIDELKEKGLLEEDDGALIVRLDDYHMPPALMVKKDGGTLYHTRDVAAALYRKQTYDFDKCIYVTDYAQNLHFQQWFKIVELMGYDWADDLEHVAFGRVSLEGEGFSTRKGNVIMLEDLLARAIEKTKDIIENKNPNLENKDEVARQVGVGAIVFNDLSSNRIKDIIFSWEDVLNFDGETGPYVQYTYARCCSLLRRAAEASGSAAADALNLKPEALDYSLLADDISIAVLKELSYFPERVVQAKEKLEPSIVSRYLVDLAQRFNRFYHDCPILVDDASLRAARLGLVSAVRTVLGSGLKLLGIETPEKI